MRSETDNPPRAHPDGERGTAAADFFCPALHVRRDDLGVLHVRDDAASFDAFIKNCFPAA